MKLLLIALLVLIALPLASGMTALLRDDLQGMRFGQFILVRVGLSFGLFVLLVIGALFGWWRPHSFLRQPRIHRAG